MLIQSAFKLKERGIHTFFAGLLGRRINIVHGHGHNFLGAVQSKQPSISCLAVFLLRCINLHFELLLTTIQRSMSELKRDIFILPVSLHVVASH